MVFSCLAVLCVVFLANISYFVFYCYSQSAGLKMVMCVTLEWTW